MKLLSTLFLVSLASACAMNVEVPLHRHTVTGLIFVDVKYENQKGRFLLDTGTSYPIVSSEFMKQIDDGGRKSNFQTDETVVPRSFSVGKVRYSKPGPFLIKDLSSIGELVGHDVDGILGAAILNLSDYSIDFEHNTLKIGRVWDSESRPYDMSFANERPIAGITIDGLHAEFVVDTGAIQSFISPKLAEIVPNSSVFSSSAEYLLFSVDGRRSSTMRRVLIKDLQFGGAHIDEKSFFVEGECAIGLDVLALGELIVSKSKGQFSFELNIKR